MATVLRLVIVIACTLLLAAMVWVVSGYFLTLPLGLFYGWSGHPALPAAPEFVYILLYLVILPAVSIYLSWRVLRRFARPRDQALGSGA